MSDLIGLGHVSDLAKSTTPDAFVIGGIAMAALGAVALGADPNVVLYFAGLAIVVYFCLSMTRMWHEQRTRQQAIDLSYIKGEKELENAHITSQRKALSKTGT